MREIIIIKTDNGQKLKKILEREEINYRIIYDNISVDNEEENWKKDILLANKDEVRKREISEWDKISKVKDIQGW